MKWIGFVCTIFLGWVLNYVVWYIYASIYGEKVDLEWKIGTSVMCSCTVIVSLPLFVVLYC